nr:MAG TPA: hypothetical protein [Caudoviricetes sp.]
MFISLWRGNSHAFLISFSNNNPIVVFHPFNYFLSFSLLLTFIPRILNNNLIHTV